MLKKLFSLLWLLAELGCATAGKTFAPMGNCVQSKTVSNAFSCVSAAGQASDLNWTDPAAQTLVCFQFQEFKLHEETCHQ